MGFVVLLDPHTGMHGGTRTVGGVQASGSDEVFFGDPANLRYPARWIFLNTLPELRKAYTPLIHEFLIVQLLIDDDIQHAQGQGIVCPWSYLEEDVCLGGVFREAGMDHNQLGPLLFADHDVPSPGGMGHHRVAPPEHHAPAIAIVRANL